MRPPTHDALRGAYHLLRPATPRHPDPIAATAAAKFEALQLLVDAALISPTQRAEPDWAEAADAAEVFLSALVMLWRDARP